MLTKCIPNFKFKRFTHKRIFKIYHCVLVRDNCQLQLYKLVDLKYRFVGESFELEIWHTSYQHKYDFMKRISWKNRKFSIFGRVAKFGSSEIFYMLVNFEYLFLGKSFGLKTWQICY